MTKPNPYVTAMIRTDPVFALFTAYGHIPQLMDEDYVDENGDCPVDIFVCDGGIHNGPGCTACHFNYCRHCVDITSAKRRFKECEGVF